jgi:hypothetical protein
MGGGSGGLFDFLDDAVRNFLEWHPRLEASLHTVATLLAADRLRKNNRV